MMCVPLFLLLAPTIVGQVLEMIFWLVRLLDLFFFLSREHSFFLLRIFFLIREEEILEKWSEKRFIWAVDTAGYEVNLMREKRKAPLCYNM